MSHSGLKCFVLSLTKKFSFFLLQLTTYFKCFKNLLPYCDGRFLHLMDNYGLYDSLAGGITDNGEN